MQLRPNSRQSSCRRALRIARRLLPSVLSPSYLPPSSLAQMPAEVWAVLNYRTKAPANAAEVQPRLEWQLLHTTGVKRWSTSAVDW